LIAVVSVAPAVSPDGLSVTVDGTAPPAATGVPLVFYTTPAPSAPIIPLSLSDVFSLGNNASALLSRH
jgi:hypothetical protein